MHGIKNKDGISMQLQLDINIPPYSSPIKYGDRILLIGSCFAENITQKLEQNKFDVLCNPHGIVYSPISLADSLSSYIANKAYIQDDLFFMNELWSSWEHHSRFSHTLQESALEAMNRSQEQAHEFLSSADHLIITLGTAYQHYRKDTGMPVANNHKAPSNEFEKVLLPVEEIVSSLSEAIDAITAVNPKLQVIFTVSPVRHIREGLVNNNRSKSHLISAVHTLVAEYDNAYYFPAYELVVDVLRDYRFFDEDMVHPNTLAINYVWEQFVQTCIDKNSTDIMKEVATILTAMNHRPRFPETDGHQKFLKHYRALTSELMQKHPMLHLEEELSYFDQELVEKKD